MNKPSIGHLSLLAALGVLACSASIGFSPHKSALSYGVLFASFAAGAAIIMSVYFYAPHRWQSVAGLHGSRANLNRLAPKSATQIGHGAAAGAVVGPVVVAALSVVTGWSKAAIVACISAWVGGLTIALVCLWAVLLTLAKAQDSAK